MEGAVGSIAYWSAAALLLWAMLKITLVRDLSGCRSKIGLVYCCSVGWLLAVAASMPAVMQESTGLFPELGVALCWLIVLMIQVLVSIKLTEWIECHRAVALVMVFIASGLLTGIVEHRKGEFASYSDGQMLLPLFGFWPGFHRAITGEIEIELPRHD